MYNNGKETSKYYCRFVVETAQELEPVPRHVGGVGNGMGPPPEAELNSAKRQYRAGRTIIFG
jgi:hypothetical protein